MKQETHKQCRMVRPAFPGNFQEYVAWIPSKFAEVGRLLDIKEDDGTWTTGWRVREVYTELPTAVVREQDYKKTRKASDI